MPKLTFSVIFIEHNYFVHHFFGSITTLLGVLNLLRVTPLLHYEIENVKHIVVCLMKICGETGGEGIWPC